MNKPRKNNRAKLKRRLITLGLAGATTAGLGVLGKKGFDKYQLHRKKKRVIDEINRRISR